MTGPSAADIKVCCATAYQQDAVTLILGESYHPGGLGLTRRLAQQLGLRVGERVLDVASGPGAATSSCSPRSGSRSTASTFGGQAVAHTNALAAERDLSGQVRFHLGDAERVPLPDASVDAVFCESAFCTFPDKPTTAAEMARVLKPGGRVGITDVALDPARASTPSCRRSPAGSPAWPTPDRSPSTTGALRRGRLAGHPHRGPR